MEPQVKTESAVPGPIPAGTPPPPGPAPAGTLMVSLPVTEQPGDRIGRYKLLQEIGEGGCGVVYMAEQEEPVRRRVALKVIKLGMDTKSVIARFEAERQALALMDHPNIAKVLDAGSTDNGRPFFVMELVRGVRITEYCDQHKLPTPDRLKLFVQVCRAIQHAHQKGIIHRDIKPSNILVTLHDGVPVPKVIDFGIAKATQGRLTDLTLFTAFEQFIGTPAYMSPEQAEMSGLDVDTRSDIYSLGVLLYELLTGQTPFDVKQLMASGLDYLRRAIREKEPDRPSTRLRTMLQSDLTTTAQRRQTDPPKLIYMIRGDLDWIVMKSLEKDRTRRYETSNGLALDVERHRNNEPVLARPPSRSYRLQKMVRRNKGMVAATAAVVLALLIGFGLSLYLFIQEHRAHDRAVVAELEQARLRKQAEEALATEEKLRGQAQISDELSQASTLLSEGHYDQAEKLALTIPHAAAATVLSSLAFLHGRHSEWSQAITNFTRIAELTPSEPQPYIHLGALYAETGDQEAFRRNSQEILARFAESRPPGIQQQLARACLLLPPRPEDLPTLTGWAGVARGTNRPRVAVFQNIRGLAEYRLGHFVRARDLLQPLVAQEQEPFRIIQSLMIVAMAQQQLGQAEQARATLARGLKLAELNIPKNNARDLGNQWSDCLIAQVLLREAKALIPPGSGTPN